MSDPSPSGETWVCRANPAVYGVCTSPVGAIPGHNGCGPVPSSDTASDERARLRDGSGRFVGTASDERARLRDGSGRFVGTASDERARLRDGSGRFVGTASDGKPCPGDRA